MNPEIIFSIANTAVLAGWGGLVFAPGWKYTQRVVVLGMILAQAVLYAGLIAYALSGPSGGGGFSSLAGVALLFQNPWALLAGWVHYLCFDLFVGAHEVRDARASGMPHWAVLPCLALTFLFGPAGFLAYNLVKLALRRAPYAIKEG